MSTSVFKFGAQDKTMDGHSFSFSFKQDLAKTQKLQTFNSNLFSFGNDSPAQCGSHQGEMSLNPSQESFQFGLYHKKPAAFSFKPSAESVFNPVNTNPVAASAKPFKTSSNYHKPGVIDYRYEIQNWAESNKENIDPLTGRCATSRPHPAPSNKDKFENDRLALKDITNTYQCHNQRVPIMPVAAMSHMLQDVDTVYSQASRAAKRSRSDNAALKQVSTGNLSEIPIKFVPADYEKEQQLLNLFKAHPVVAARSKVVADSKSVFSAIRTMSKAEQKNVFKKVVKLR